MDRPPLPYSCGIYTRQSRQRAQEFSSCDAQFEACFDFIQARFGEGWQWNGHRYDDEGTSGETLARPAISRLLDDIRAGRVDRVVVHRLDRLSRRLSDIVALLTDLREAGIALTVVTEPHLGTSAEHTLALNIMASMAEFEHDMICGRLADTRAALKRQGRRVAGLVPYGYVSDPLTKQLLIEPVEAEHVQLLFQWAAEGKPAREIANLATRKGWRTKVRISRHDGTKGGGGHWTPRQVLETLANPTYAGLVRDGQRLRTGSHPAIVPVDRFEQARREINSRRTQSSRRHSSVGRWPLQGLLICGQCQRIMSPSVSWHGSKGYRYYRCRSNAGGQPPCHSVCAPAGEIEQLIANEVNLRLRNANSAPPDWGRLSLAAQNAAFARFVRRVAFSPAKGELKVEFAPVDATEGEVEPSRCTR